MRNSIYTIIAILLCSVYVQAQESDYGELWNKANNHYSLGEYQQALSDYKKIEEGGMVSYKQKAAMPSARSTSMTWKSCRVSLRPARS